MRTSSAVAWICARMPSYLSSANAPAPSIGHDLVRILLRLREHERERMKEVHRAESSASDRASSAAAPMSPVSMFARRTAASGRPNAFAIADSTSPSCSPMRNSRSRILTTKRTPCASSFRSSATSTFFFSLGARRRREPLERLADLGQRHRARRIVVEQLGDRVAGVAVLRPRRPHFVRRSAGRLDDRVADSAAPPTPAVRWSLRGNGEPEKKTTARSSDASSSVTR